MTTSESTESNLWAGIQRRHVDAFGLAYLTLNYQTWLDAYALIDHAPSLTLSSKYALYLVASSDLLQITSLKRYSYRLLGQKLNIFSSHHKN